MESDSEDEKSIRSSPKEVVETVENSPPMKSSKFPFKIPPVRLIILGCNIVLSFLAFVCTTALCGETKFNFWYKNNSTGVPKWESETDRTVYKFCDSDQPGEGFRRVYIIWIIINFAEIVITSAVLAVYILIPKWKYKENFQILMTLYNVIQSLLHIYFWMLGTLKEEVGRDTRCPHPECIVTPTAAMVTAVLFTQVNGFLYFAAIFFSRERISKADDDQLQSLGSPNGDVGSPDIGVSGEQTMDNSEVQMT